MGINWDQIDAAFVVSNCFGLDYCCRAVSARLRRTTQKEVSSSILEMQVGTKDTPDSGIQASNQLFVIDPLSRNVYYREIAFQGTCHYEK